MKRIYVESDDLAPLITWLKTKPDGDLRILVGNADKDTVNKVMRAITKEGRDFAVWVAKKMRVKQMEIASTAEKLDALPKNEVVED